MPPKRSKPPAKRRPRARPTTLSSLQHLGKFWEGYDFGSTTLLAVDPSINNIGLAWFVNGKPQHDQVLRTKSVKRVTREERLAHIVTELPKVLAEHPADLAVLEDPDSWTRSRGRGSVNVKDLLTLSTALGAILSTLNANNIATLLVGVEEWKGVMTKEATMRRFKLRHGYVIANQHAQDAASLGQWASDRVVHARATLRSK